MFTRLDRSADGFAMFSGGRGLRTRGPAVISADMTVMGDVRGSGELRIDGEVGGDVVCRHVTVGEDGYVEGGIYAETVHIAGTLDGRVEAMDITVARTARITGTLTHHRLEIEPGAKLDAYRPWRPASYIEARRRW